MGSAASTSDQVINIDAIKIHNVGRVDSVLYDLDDFEIPQKVSRHQAVRFMHHAPKQPISRGSS